MGEGTTQAGYSFLCLAIHEDEITKLWGELGLFSATMTAVGPSMHEDSSERVSGATKGRKESGASLRPPAIRTSVSTVDSSERRYGSSSSLDRRDGEFNSFPRKLRVAIRLLDVYAPMPPDEQEETTSASSTRNGNQKTSDDQVDETKYSNEDNEDKRWLARLVQNKTTTPEGARNASSANGALEAHEDEPPWAKRGAVAVAAGRLQEERRLFYEKLSQKKLMGGIKAEARREAFFKLFGIAGQKKRKQTLAARLWQRRDEADLSSHVVLATFEELNSPGDAAIGGVEGGEGSVVIASPQDFTHQKLQQRIRFDVLTTVKACLVSIRKSHRKLSPDKRALNKVRKKCTGFMYDLLVNFLKFIPKRRRRHDVLSALTHTHANQSTTDASEEKVLPSIRQRARTSSINTRSPKLVR